MQLTEMVNDIHVFCRANADEAIVKKYSRYFTEGYDAYGLSSEATQSIVTEILDRESVTIDLIYQLGDTLVKSHKYEETFLATLLLKHFTAEFSVATFAAVSHWFEIGVVNWAHCDVLCRDITGVLLKNKIVDLTALVPWQTATNTYQRRAVPVTMIEILKDTTDFALLFDLAEPLMHDTEKKVQQGLGWFLREAWKLQPEPTEAFLLKWKNTAPRVIYQYACEKMNKDQKQRFRKEKR